MSAYKTAFIRLGESEYKRLRDAEEQLRLNNLLNTELKNEIEHHEKSIYENMMGIKKQNDRNFQNLVVDLESELSRIQNDASTWVENQATRLQSELINYQDSIQIQAEEQIQHVVNQANEHIQQKNLEMESYWFSQEERIASIENRWKAYEDQALNWIMKDQEILNFIYDSYKIDAIGANQLELQREYINQVINQYNQGFFDIAASAGFQIFSNLTNIRFQLELDRTLQAFQYQNLLAKAANLQESLSLTRTVHAMDGDGNELPELIDVDYWVDGRYQEYSLRINSLIQAIQSDISIDQSSIKNYTHQVSEFSDGLIDLVTQARMIVLASQLRFNVAQIIVQALESQGFFLEQANYDKDDFRESFFAKTRNFSGNEVLVSIDPDPGLDEGGKLHIQSLDANQITEHELLQRNAEIFNAIKENGIEVSNIHEVEAPLAKNPSLSKRKRNNVTDIQSLSKGNNLHGRN